MSTAGGPLWNVGGGYGYRPYALATQGARRLSGFGDVSPPVLGDDPVAVRAKEAAAKVIARASAQGVTYTMPTLYKIAAVLQPDGAEKLRRDMEWMHREGRNKQEAMFQSLSSMIANAYSRAILSGTPPSWAAPKGLGAWYDEWSWSDLTDGLQAAACTPGAGGLVGLVVADDKKMGVAAGAAGGEILCQTMGGRKKGKAAAPPGKTVVVETETPVTPAWVWPVVIGTTAVVLLGGGAFLWKRKGR